MKEIKITVENKVAKFSKPIPVIVCDNSDYKVVFEFDSEWDNHPVKTMRVKYNDNYEEVVFSGNEAVLPKFNDTLYIQIGVYSGDLMTTTPATVKCLYSILSGNPKHIEPTEDVYNQLIELIQDLNKWGKVTGNIDEQTDLKEKLDSKENKLPEVIKNRFLHTNAESGEYEWKDVGGSGTVEWGNISGEIENQTDLKNTLTGLGEVISTKSDKVYVDDELEKKVTNNGNGVSSALYNLNFNSEQVNDDTQVVLQNSPTEWIRRKLSVISDWVMSKVENSYISKSSKVSLCQHFVAFGSTTYGSLWYSMKIINKYESPMTLDMLAKWLYRAGYTSGSNAYGIDNSSTFNANLDNTGNKLWWVYAVSCASENKSDLVFFVCNSINTNHRTINVENAGIEIKSNAFNVLGKIIND